MGHLHRDLTETSAADVALAPDLAGPARTGRIVAVTRLAVYARLGPCGPGADDREVVGLLGPGAVRVPGAIAVAGAWPALAARAPVGGLVRLGGGVLVLGGVRIRPVRWYDAHVPRVAVTADPPDAAGLGLPPLPEPVATRAGAFATALTHRLADGDAERLADAVRGLVGLGPGLTPAGDDVLAGALVTLAATGGDAAALDRLVAPLRPRTTIVSAALLRCAAAGRAVPQLARFVTAAASGRAATAMVQDLLRVGSTSGAALAHGALAALGAPAREVA